MRKYLIESIVGILVTAGLLFVGYMIAKLANENVDTMIEQARWTQEISAVY